MKSFILIVIITLSACNSSNGDRNNYVKASDPIGISEFTIENISNYQIKVQSETIQNEYPACSEQAILSGEQLRIAEYADFGTVAFVPDNIFSNLYVLADFGDGKFVESIHISGVDWKSDGAGTARASYFFQVTDALLLQSNSEGI